MTYRNVRANVEIVFISDNIAFYQILLNLLNSKFSKMPEEIIIDFWAHYSCLCLKSKIFPLTSVLKKIKGTKLQCPVEAIRKEHWPLLLSALNVDNSFTEIYFFTRYSLDEQKEMCKEKKKKKSNLCFPIPYGCSAKNIADICMCVANLLHSSEALKVLKIENLCLRHEDFQSLSKGLKDSNIEKLSLAGCQLLNESIEVICRSLQSSNVELLDLSSCGLSELGMISISDLIKAHHLKRSNDMFPDTLRYRLPVFDAMKGLRRIYLNNNDIGNKGMEILMNSLEEDMWMKAFDLQKCGIGNEGAKSILKVLKSNVGLQLIDMRQNDIDDSLIDRIALQLSLNNSQKEIKYQLGDLWESKSKKIIRCKVMKVKSVKRLSPPKFGKNLSLKNHVKTTLQIKKPKVKDANTQTTSELSDEMIEMQKVLSHEIRMQKSLKHLVKKYKMENSLLRKELDKMAVLDDYILMDQETFIEVKNTFEKFKKFLEAMKKYGLWECLEMLEVDGKTDISVKQVITEILKKSAHLNENKPSTSKTNDLISLHSSIMEKHIPLEQYRSHRKHESLSSQSKITRDFQNFHDQNAANIKYMLGQSSTKQFSGMQTKVMKVYKDVCDNYSRNYNSSRAFHETNYREIQKPERHVSDDYINHIETFLRESGHKTLKNITKSKPTVVREQSLSRKKSVHSQTPATDITSDEQKSPSASHKTDSEKIRLKENASVSSYTSHIMSDNTSTSHEQSAHESNISSEYKSLPRKNISDESIQDNKNFSVEKSEIYKHQVHAPHISDISLHSEKILSSDSDVTLKSSKISVEKLSSNKSHPKTKTHSNRKAIKKESVESHNSSAKSDVSEPVSSVSSYNSKKVVKSAVSSGKGDSYSYLESVSDASTDKDVQSLTLSEVYSSPKHKNDMKNSDNISESSKVNEEPVESVVSLDEKLSDASQKSIAHSSIAKSSKVIEVPVESVAALDEKLSDASQKSIAYSSKSKSSKSKHTLKKLQSLHIEERPKENLSDASIPSLSDITTVSSRSLNTDSVMDQLSE
ncbi:centrosomal protein of 78 kDa [Nephila pilipes]|uniref:Centrosomal protein of 78 kDa n=1 Tax=Nephila pilipes TaxID=299642 RepID=A0A8X6NM43_NEPPI|nr:centrosomal protein of 78 kDa [Nephila pilipes]